ncbi:putative membrane protein [Collimonas fungivorans]|uniref:Putative membrane protein n=1 Tax=Collimonas fungivorans TaxID=158899 RepID=A0A127PD09_9BURK|nr:putative membrane protein [Collimonas fungivorans]
MPWQLSIACGVAAPAREAFAAFLCCFPLLLSFAAFFYVNGSAAA